MKNVIKKILISSIAVGSILAAGQIKESSAASSSISWSFKNNEFKNLGKINSTKTINNLSLIATSSKTMTIKNTNASLNGESFTSALALSGTGNTNYRSVKVPVDLNSVLKVTLNSSSNRTLQVADTKGNKLTTLSAEKSIATRQWTYTGSDKFVYLYSTNSNINLYKIQVDYSGSSTSGTGTGSNTGSNTGSTSTTAPSGSIEVKAGGMSLSDAMKKAKSGQTVVINGTVKSGRIDVPSGVNIKGINNAKIDFSSTSGSQGKGLVFNGKGSTVENIIVTNAADNGIYIEGSNNTFKYVTTTHNHDAGFQVSNGGAYNKFIKCESTYNADAAGENADGYAVKLHSGEGNYFENCTASYNSDDGWDCYAAHGAVKLVNCKALYNGLCEGIRGDGNGFKMGGVDNKTPGVKAHLDPLKHELIGCEARGNYASGFDRNNQSGVVTMKNCIADNNKKNNYNWPAKGKPSALGYEVTFGKAVIDSCTSKNGTNNISGATLTGNCVGF
ncbi:MAG: right-handed parallel beta-helix repeat-containing protein [Acholeplasmatales bacterium]|nr:right-handed parallel beta-helix repeat-containing protein [Acholeplasmatales bacterium]